MSSKKRAKTYNLNDDSKYFTSEYRYTKLIYYPSIYRAIAFQIIFVYTYAYDYLISNI